jgi:hypothetical protein
VPYDLFSHPEGAKKVKYAKSRPLKISYSSFKNVQQCPAKYAMANVLYLIPKTVDCRNFCLGSVGHTCMERWIKEAEMRPGFMQSIAEQEFDLYLENNTVIPLNKTDLAEMRKKSVKNAQAIEDTFFQYGLHEKKLVSEQNWKIPFPGKENVLLIGKMDVTSPADNIIYDLKVTTSATFMDDDQLIIYGMLGTLSGLKTTQAGFIVPLRKEKIVTKTFEAIDYQTMYRRLRDEITLIEANLESGKWEYKYNKSTCFRCQVKELCPAYKSETSEVEDGPVIDYGGGRVIKF